MALIAFAALLGTLLPLLIAVVQREHWPDSVRALVALLLAAVAAAAVMIGRGDWHGLTQTSLDAYGTAFTGLIVTTWGSYTALWKQLGVTKWIEHLTTFTIRHRNAVEAILSEAAKLDQTQKQDLVQRLQA